jgi:transposase
MAIGTGAAGKWLGLGGSIQIEGDGSMSRPLVSDALWERIEPLLPPPKARRFRYPGRKPLDRRKVLMGIIFVLRTGIPWEELPTEMGCGSGMSCWNYLVAWQRAGVWDKLHHILLNELQEADRIDWSRASADSSHARALGGGENTGKNPTDRGKPGTKHHIVTDAQGIPLATTATGSNVPDVKELLNVVDKIPPVSGKVGHPRKRPDEMYADRAYDSDPHREELKRRGIDPKIARRNTDNGSGLGIYRWVVERTASWLHSFRRLRLRTDRAGDAHDAFLALGSALICMWFL